MKISVNGIRRSGNHALAVWLLYHFNGGIEYFNNWNSKSERKNGELYLHKNSIMLALQQTRLGTSFSDNHTINIDNTFYGLENHTLQEIRDVSVEKDLDYNLIILRDPINNIASLMEYSDKRKIKRGSRRLSSDDNSSVSSSSSVSDIDTNVDAGAWNVGRNSNARRNALIKHEDFLKLWKDYAKNAMNYDNNILIIYDKWFSDESYRRGLENSLNLPNNDRGLDKMHFTGNGSSFDGMDFQNDAQNMNVLNRWEKYVDNEEFLERVNDQELLDLREEIFGPLPFTL